MSSVREQLEKSDAWVMIPDSIKESIIQKVEQIAEEGKTGSHSFLFGKEKVEDPVVDVPVAEVPVAEVPVTKDVKEKKPRAPRKVKAPKST